VSCCFVCGVRCVVCGVWCVVCVVSSKRDVKPSRGFQRIEMEEVEVTAELVMAYCNRIMRKPGDLQKLHEALIRELPETTQLPKLPPEQPSQQAESSAFPFSVWIGSYLACLACNRDALERYSFQNFFQLADAHNDRISALRLSRQTELAQPPSPPLPGSQAQRRHRCLLGMLLLFVLHRRNQGWTTGSDSPRAATAVPKSAAVGLSKVGESDLYSADYGLSAKPLLVAVVVRCGMGGGADRSALSMGLAS